MPIYGATGETSPGFPRRPPLPTPPADPALVVPYLKQLDAAIVDSTDSERLRLQSYVSQFNATTFGAAVTSVAVTFGSAEPDADYMVVTQLAWNTKVWITSLASTGFTITVADAPGGSGLDIKWAVIR